jgi:predicted nucleotidyltransferase
MLDAWCAKGAGSMNTRKEASPAIENDRHLRKLIGLLEGYNPERIILFGSRARAQADEHSDYDILVVKRTDRPFLERLQDMIPVLVAFDRPAEILVYTPEELANMSGQGLGWIVEEEGVVVYERPSS